MVDTRRSDRRAVSSPPAPLAATMPHVRIQASATALFQSEYFTARGAAVFTRGADGVLAHVQQRISMCRRQNDYIGCLIVRAIGSLILFFHRKFLREHPTVFCTHN
jgi:hypothetical protein